MQQLVFKPLELANAGIDDDSLEPGPQLAKGYQPEGTYGLKPATAIHRSARAGSASVITTAGDEARWVAALFTGKALSAASRSTLLDTAMRVGFGWFKGQNQRFNQTAYYMNGRSPGFSSFVLYLPDGQLAVVVLSNIYSSATTKIGDLAAILLGLGYTAPSDRRAAAHQQGAATLHRHIPVRTRLLPVKREGHPESEALDRRLIADHGKLNPLCVNPRNPRLRIFIS